MRRLLAAGLLVSVLSGCGVGFETDDERLERQRQEVVDGRADLDGAVAGLRTAVDIKSKGGSR